MSGRRPATVRARIGSARVGNRSLGVQRVECRPALGRSRHQKAAALGLHQRQRLPRRQRNALQQLQPRPLAPRQAQPLEQPSGQSARQAIHLWFHPRLPHSSAALISAVRPVPCLCPASRCAPSCSRQPRRILLMPTPRQTNRRTNCVRSTASGAPPVAY